MKGIIVAAGLGSRLGELTKNTPKSLIEINGKSILERQIFAFKKFGITDITVIIGPHAEKYSFEGISFIHDDSYLEHDILSSFMLARKIIDDDTIVSYGDVIFDENILLPLINFKGLIGLGIDFDWEKNYVNRDQHPKSEAENVLINGNEILELRKNISECKENEKIGECLGLMKFSRKASKVFLDKYSELEISHQGKFHNASSLEKALISDMIQELIDSEINVEPIYVSGKWCEIDTPQDLEIARKMFEE